MAQWEIAAAFFCGAGIALAAGAAFIARQQERLGRLVGTMHAMARRERFIAVPYPGAGGLTGRLSAAISALKALVGEADMLAAEQQAAHEQQRFRQAARAHFIELFEHNINSLIATLNGAAETLRSTSSGMLAQADETLSRSTASSLMSESAAASVAVVADVADKLMRMVSHLHERSARARETSLAAVQTVEATDKSVVELADGARRIGRVVDMIGGIAGQSRMLALNATIEAERGGSGGKGFAVVATEVKNFSSQTADATAAIAGDIGRMNGTVGNAIVALDEIGRAMREIERTAHELTETIARDSRDAETIGRLADEVARYMRGIAENVADVTQSSSQTRRTADELTVAADALAESAARMRGAIAGFLRDINRGAIRIGVIHALSGTMAAAERPLKDMLVMLAEEVNRQGGLLGRPLELVIVNPRSDWNLYAPLAERLLVEDRVAALFGCWTSVSRKQIVPVVERHGGLLFYPSQYEGEEQSANVFYTGATPNQQALPAIDYLMSPQGGGFRRFALIGTDYVYPQVTNRILQAYLAEQGIAAGDIMAALTPFGHEDWGDIVGSLRRFAAAGPCAIISTVNGDANVHFHRELRRQRLDRTRHPVMSFSIGESEAVAIGPQLLAGSLLAWSYLSPVDTPENHAFRQQWQAFRRRQDAVTDDPLEATWIGFHLWCEAVRDTGTTDPAAVAAALAGRRLRSPGGFDIAMDEANHHLHKPVMIGRIGADGQVEIVHRSQGPLAPEPFSRYLAASPAS